jgi:diguanylate cyclase (GGDEF)-like protein
VDIRTILYVHVYLLIGIAVGLVVIAWHPHFRHFRNLAAAFIAGAASTLLRIADGHLPSLISIVFANGLLLVTFVLIHRCMANFVQGGSRTRGVEALLVGGGCVGLAFFTLVHPSIDGRSLVLSSGCGAIGMLSALVLLRCKEGAERRPCLATAGLFLAFALTMAMRCVGVLLHNVPREYFVSSLSNLVNLFGFQIVIVGVPLGYFWMTSTRLWAGQNELARTDALTGLPNRRAFEEGGERVIEQSRSGLMSFAVLAIDVDHFKHINDRYGHKGGDTALRCMAQALTAAVRKEDLVARLGGEEFVVLLENEGVEEARCTAERIRQIVEALNISVDDQVVKATVSAGVAVFEASDTLETVLRRADRALYAAKLAGRNRVMLESSPVPMG